MSRVIQSLPSHSVLSSSLVSPEVFTKVFFASNPKLIECPDKVFSFPSAEVRHCSGEITMSLKSVRKYDQCCYDHGVRNANFFVGFVLGIL